MRQLVRFLDLATRRIVQRQAWCAGCTHGLAYQFEAILYCLHEDRLRIEPEEWQ
jgi:hypothetical protein